MLIIVIYLTNSLEHMHYLMIMNILIVSFILLSGTLCIWIFLLGHVFDRSLFNFGEYGVIWFRGFDVPNFMATKLWVMFM